VKYSLVVVAAAALLALRVWIFTRRRRRRAAGDSATTGRDAAAVASPAAASVASPAVRPADAAGSARGWQAIEGSLGGVGLIAMREIRERIRGRIFRIGTLLMLVAVGAAIVIPTLHSSSSSTPTVQTVGVVGHLAPEAKQLLYAAASANDDTVKLVPESSLAAAKTDLRSGELAFAIVNDDQLYLNQPAAAKNSPADPSLVQAMAEYLGVVKAYQTAGLTPSQAALVTNSKSVPVHTLEAGSKASTNGASVVGLILLFFMLTQYCTWILIGVMQEKTSRVVEVLLATVRPIQLLGGKVLGIGMVALGQATLIVGFALIVGKAVGSDLLHGTAPLVLGCELLWLVLGYAFYCWMYAAAGSTAERQDQVQTLALPLSIPILLGYIFSITVASSGQPDLFFKILAYLPPTAPFCMSVLVGLRDVTWWQFVASVLITLAGTAGMAIFAARIYSRAVLRTGGRVRVRELLAHEGR
jgi:ABC-2 type transport system permease protein